MALNERRLKNLVRFCEKFSLEVWVSGTKYQTVSSDDSELSDDPDSFRLDIVPTEQKVSELGAVGREILPPVNPELGYTEVILNEDTEVPFGGYQQWFDGTLFEQPRPEQKQVVPTVAKLLRQGYENIVLEMPTGAGCVRDANRSR
jgi:hypothetical protein